MIYRNLIKPLLDRLFALVLIVILSPIITVVAVLIRVRLGSPVVFVQPRPGKNGRIFNIYKFRTMSDERDEKGELLPDQVRLGKFGRAIRKLSLDELPQLFNVLKGEMSFIGPRPLLVEYLPLYNADQAKRHDVLGGITGWAQVNGRNAISWQEKFALDVWYVENLSFWLDCKIIWLTLIRVIRGSGVDASESVTMEKFKGNR